MARSRLTLALDTGAITLPETGDIAVIQPRQEHDLSALSKPRITVFQGFYPDHQFFLNHGFKTEISISGNFSTAVVFLPRAKSLARNLIHTALNITGGAPIIIDGQKTDGIDSILKDCRAHGGDVRGVFSKAHGKLFSLSGGDFDDWIASGPTEITAGNTGGFVTRAGVFSAAGIDRGSAALVAALPEKLTGNIADLGAGWGYLAHHILQRPGVRQCHLIEAEHTALQCARQNVTDPRAQFHWQDVRSFAPQSRFDTIITNPPFHTGRSANPDLGREFIQAAQRLLSPRGVVWLVANRHLPYEQHLSAAFREVAEVQGDRGFKVIRAAVPQPVQR